MNDEVTFRILDHVGTIAPKPAGWNREVNVVSWNGGKAKVDIRDWDGSHERMTRGVTFTEEEAIELSCVLNKRYFYDDELIRILVLFSHIYSLLYDMKIPENPRLVDACSSWLRINRDKAEALVKKRGDLFTSDRELNALALALNLDPAAGSAI